MDVACFDSGLFAISFAPVVVALEGAQVDWVFDQSRLHQVISVRFHRHCRARVDLDQPWFHFVINHDIEAEYFEAAFEIGDEGAKIDGSQHDYLFHARPH